MTVFSPSFLLPQLTFAMVEHARSLPSHAGAVSVEVTGFGVTAFSLRFIFYPTVSLLTPVDHPSRPLSFFLPQSK